MFLKFKYFVMAIAIVATLQGKKKTTTSTPRNFGENLKNSANQVQNASFPELSARCSHLLRGYQDLAKRSESTANSILNRVAVNIYGKSQPLNKKLLQDCVASKGLSEILNQYNRNPHKREGLLNTCQRIQAEYDRLASQNNDIARGILNSYTYDGLPLTLERVKDCCSGELCRMREIHQEEPIDEDVILPFTNTQQITQEIETGLMPLLSLQQEEVLKQPIEEKQELSLLEQAHNLLEKVALITGDELESYRVKAFDLYRQLYEMNKLNPDNELNGVLSDLDRKFEIKREIAFLIGALFQGYLFSQNEIGNLIKKLEIYYELVPDIDENLLKMAADNYLNNIKHDLNHRLGAFILNHLIVLQHPFSSDKNSLATISQRLIETYNLNDLNVVLTTDEDILGYKVSLKSQPLGIPFSIFVFNKSYILRLIENAKKLLPVHYSV